jgi:hypothetical protein
MKKHLFITFVLFLFHLVAFAQNDSIIHSNKLAFKSITTSDSSLQPFFKDGKLEFYILENGKQSSKFIIISFDLFYRKGDEIEFIKISGNTINSDFIDKIISGIYTSVDFFIKEIVVKNTEINKTKIFTNNSIKVSLSKK